MALLLNTNAVAKAYGVTTLFSNLSLSIEDGDRLGVIGPNGSGKSTLLEILAGRVDADSGAVVEALVGAAQILLLDEPTNHLDLAGIQWLELLLKNAPFACVLVSHDRYFLENVPTSMAELNRLYPDGLLMVKGNYSVFLEKK